MHEVKPETDVETLVSDSPFLLLHERDQPCNAFKQEMPREMRFMDGRGPLHDVGLILAVGRDARFDSGRT